MKVVTKIISLILLMLSLSLSAKHIQHEPHSNFLIIEITLIGNFSYPAKGPFGQLINSNVTVENPYQYNTKYTDSETNLVYYGYRYYDANNGRWLNQDPIGERGGINVYNSVSNNMVNGFAGGIGYSAGMGRSVGFLGAGYEVDAFGKMSKIVVHPIQFINSWSDVRSGFGNIHMGDWRQRFAGNNDMTLGQAGDSNKLNNGDGMLLTAITRNCTKHCKKIVIKDNKWDDVEVFAFVLIDARLDTGNRVARPDRTRTTEEHEQLHLDYLTQAWKQKSALTDHLLSLALGLPGDCEPFKKANARRALIESIWDILTARASYLNVNLEKIDYDDSPKVSTLVDSGLVNYNKAKTTLDNAVRKWNKAFPKTQLGNLRFPLPAQN